MFKEILNKLAGSFVISVHTVTFLKKKKKSCIKCHDSDDKYSYLCFFFFKTAVILQQPVEYNNLTVEYHKLTVV